MNLHVSDGFLGARHTSLPLWGHLVTLHLKIVALDGHAIRDLKTADITLTENGKTQRMAIFEPRISAFPSIRQFRESPNLEDLAANPATAVPSPWS